jgi:hypothetical protein
VSGKKMLLFVNITGWGGANYLGKKKHIPPRPSYKCPPLL